MNALTAAKPAQHVGMLDPATFDHMQRVGKMLALSSLFPEHLRKGSVEVGIANAVLVLNMAMRLKEDPLTVAQSIYFVGNKPGWSASYLIGKANQHGVFRDPIDWEVKGKGEDLSVTAFAVLSATGKRVAVTCDMKMAKAEGWTSNKKYQSMPEQMLRYRSATFMIRLYCPEVMIGVPSTIELELGMRDVTPDYVPQDSQAASEPAIEGEIITSEGEVVPAKEVAPAKAAKPAAEVKATPVTDVAEPSRDEQDQPGLDLGGAEQPSAEWLRFAAQVRANKKDGWDVVVGLFGEELERMKTEAPELRAQLVDEIEAAAERPE